MWNIIFLGGSPYFLDVTWDDPVNSTTDYIQHFYFNITAEDMALDHTWDTDTYPKNTVTGSKYSYANEENLKKITTQSDLNNYIVSNIRKRATSIEFTTTDIFDLAAAVKRAGVQLSYSYKDVERSDYVFYVVNFNLFVLKLRLLSYICHII